MKVFTWTQHKPPPPKLVPAEDLLDCHFPSLDPFLHCCPHLAPPQNAHPRLLLNPTRPPVTSCRLPPGPPGSTVGPIPLGSPAPR